MKTVSLSDAKDKLSGYVEEVEREHEIIRITRHGHGAALLVSQDDWDSLQESLFWLSQPGVREDVTEARQALRDGQTMDAAAVRARYGLPE